jgi:hypothetical protein
MATAVFIKTGVCAAIPTGSVSKIGALAVIATA